MNTRKALQQIHDKSKTGEDVTEDIAALIEAIDIEEQISKLTARLEKTITKFEINSNWRGGKRKKGTPEATETATDSATA